MASSSPKSTMSCGVTPRKRARGTQKKRLMMGGVAGADLERAVDVGEAVRVAVDETVDRQVLLVRQEPHEAPRGARRHAAHLDDDAVGALPEAVVVQALEHAAGLDGQHEARRRCENRDARPSAECCRRRCRDCAQSTSTAPPVAGFLSITVSLPATEPPCVSGIEAQAARARGPAPRPCASMSSMTASDSVCSSKRQSPQFLLM